MGLDNLAGQGGSGLWNRTFGYGMRAPEVPYLDKDQNCRLERMRVARMLWQGDHRRCYLLEGRTQFDFPEMEVQGRVWWPYISFNVLRLISTTMADLLLGEDPAISIDDEQGQAEIDALKQRSDIDRVCYDACKTASWAGEALAEVVRWQGDVYLQDVSPDEVFPIGARQPDGQFGSYKRFAVANSTEKTPRRLLLESTYLPGAIRRACYFLSDTGDKMGDAGMTLWPVKDAAGKELAPVENTGIAWNTMIWMANELDEGKPTSDYDGLIELQDELNAKQTQIARILAMHSDPAMAVPESAFAEDGTLRVKNRAFPFNSRDEIPQYIMLNADFAAAIADRDFTLNALCIAAEMSQGLLGLEKGGAPDSARKLRLQATKALSRVKRKSKFVKPFIRTATDTALLMARAGRVVQVAMGLTGDGGTAVDLQDGLPVDELDQANVISLLTGGKQAMSVERAVHLQIRDPEAAEKEMEALKTETADAAPSVVLSPVGAPLPGQPGAEGAGGAGGASESENSAAPEYKPGSDVPGV